MEYRKVLQSVQKGDTLVYSLTLMNCRDCNSRNLNQSPFCTTKSKVGPLKWANEATDLYKKTGYIPEYVKILESSSRNSYGTRRLKQEEFFAGHIEVNHYNHLIILRVTFPYSNDQTYDAYERDIAVVNIFMGKTTATGKF